MPTPTRPLRLPIADPCRENWDAMQGAGARRFCEVCATQVTNLSELTRGEAHGFLRREAGRRACVRYRSDADGNIVFKTASVTAPVPTAMSGFRATLAAAGLAALVLGACTGQRLPDRIEGERCVYELGPLGFQLERGEGNCPPEERFEEQTFVMGAVPVLEPDPQERMGKVALDDPPPPSPPPIMGEAPIVESPPPAPVEKMGDVALPPEPPVPDVQGQAEIPCDGPAGAPAVPRRL